MLIETLTACYCFITPVLRRKMKG